MFVSVSPRQWAWLVLLAGILLLNPAARATPPAKADPLTLADDGRAALPIVIAPTASDATRAVAQELATYLQRLSGAPFTVQTGMPDTPAGILVGTLTEFPDPALGKPLTIGADGHDGREAFVIRTDARRLRLLGTTDLGASHAVFRLLEELGCRWFFPGAHWEVVPARRKHLTVALNLNDRPAILARRIWYAWGFFPDLKNRGGRSRSQDDYGAWSRHNRMAASIQVSAGHAYQQIIKKNQHTFDQHPEYYALVKGKRNVSSLAKLELGNPEVRKLVVDYALEHFRKNPQADMMALDPSDGGGWSESPESKRLGSVSDQVFGLANEVARALQKQFPGKMVGLYAYNFHTVPPSFAVEPNVYIQLTAAFLTGPYNFDQLLTLWKQKTPNVGVYQYFSTWLWDQDLPPGGRANNLAYLTTQIRDYAQRRVTSFDAESGNNWALHGRGYYLANRLLWNPHYKVDSLLADFYAQAFGPAAAPMQAFYERLDQGSKPLVTSGYVAQLYRDLDAATKAARGDTTVLNRLADLKTWVRYVSLRRRIDALPKTDTLGRRDLNLTLINHLWRARYTYMDHWQGFYMNYVRQASREVNQPDWNVSSGKPKPWHTLGEWTRAEIERDFQADMRTLLAGVTEVHDERTFSNDLVPVRIPTAARALKVKGLGFDSTDSYQRYQGPASYALYSTKGEALEVTITAGLINAAHPAARYRLMTFAGDTITAGLVALDHKPHRLRLAVPKAGAYVFECDESGAGWSIRVAAGKPVVLLLTRERGISQAIPATRPWYFYVPKGTRQLQFYWHAGPGVKIYDADGREQAIVKAPQEITTVVVPPGQDGRLWQLPRQALRQMWFFNIPNVMAASPEALMLPREVATRDGLLP